MKLFHILILALMVISCGDPDDSILDGDLVTAIIGPDEVYNSATGGVDFSYSVAGEGAFVSGEGSIVSNAGWWGNGNSSLTFDFNVRNPSEVSEVSFLPGASNVQAIYQVFTDNETKIYEVDSSLPYHFEFLDLRKNTCEGIFEFTMRNLVDPSDTVQFKEGYFYVYD